MPDTDPDRKAVFDDLTNQLCEALDEYDGAETAEQSAKTKHEKTKANTKEATEKLAAINRDLRDFLRGQGRFNFAGAEARKGSDTPALDSVARKMFDDLERVEFEVKFRPACKHTMSLKLRRKGSDKKSPWLISESILTNDAGEKHQINIGKSFPKVREAVFYCVDHTAQAMAKKEPNARRKNAASDLAKWFATEFPEDAPDNPTAEKGDGPTLHVPGK